MIRLACKHLTHYFFFPPSDLSRFEKKTTGVLQSTHKGRVCLHRPEPPPFTAKFSPELQMDHSRHGKTLPLFASLMPLTCQRKTIVQTNLSVSFQCVFSL